MFSQDTTVVYKYRRSASGLTIVAHFFGILSLILMLVWLLHYRGGIQYDSYNANIVFNVHPFLMFFGFIFSAGEAMMMYKTVRAQHNVQKFVHMFFHLVAMVLAIVGLCAVFKYHDMQNKENMTSLHSWIGMVVVILFIIQWLFGFLYYFLGASSSAARSDMVPWHTCGGRVLLFMAICAALTGLMEKSIFIQYRNESRLINFTGLTILLFGIFVDLSVTLARYV